MEVKYELYANKRLDSIEIKFLRRASGYTG
jgi:hypothetical protein